ncbi:MAG: methyltransferase domain-containing protein [Ignavibacteriales bacterium]|nr:MAG: methyltransferase domain-containing protein [Ignavibacteriales bacterium]
MISEKVFKKFYSDRAKSGTRIFYELINSHLNYESVVLNLGAGPTSIEENRKLKGKVKRYVGADIDPLVLGNSDLDEAYVIENGVLPFNNATFDFVISDFVLEHIETPLIFLSEVHRVMKPNGSFFFRTPNRNHYVPLISYLTPHWVHVKVSNKVRGLPKETHEPYQTYYRMNSKHKLMSLSKQVGFSKFEIKLIETEPMYLKFHIVPFLIGVAYERIVNRYNILSFLRVNILGRFEK